MTTTATFTESVQRLRVPSRDRHGDPIGAAASTTIVGCIVWPRDGNASSGNEKTDSQDTVIIGLQVLMPSGTDITPTDQMLVRGQIYDVEGEPASHRSPFTGTSPGVLVSLKRVTG